MAISSIIPVHLLVQNVDSQCIFNLTWGEGHRLSATIPFPHCLDQQYQVWVKAYHSFYSSLPLKYEKKNLNSPFRGRLDHQGRLAAGPADWQAKLVQAEAELFYQFHYWLRHPSLFNIRSQFAKLARSLEGDSHKASVDIFLSVSPASLAKLPWEHWELGVEFDTRIPFRIARCPIQLPVASAPAPLFQQTKLRILIILGDECGLDFQGDCEALQSIAPFAEIQFLGRQPLVNTQLLKEEICQTIADPLGWDLLFFVGHSHGTSLTGGEFLIAPNLVLSLEQMLPYLKQACQIGLQLAVFNSCNGMEIAERLLEQGLCQVAVMREPIHNQVAHAFLQRFVLHLAEERDAQDSLHATCQDLKLNQGVTYPSAYCLPSLFRHPTTQPFKFKRVRVHEPLKHLAPMRWNAIVLSKLLFITLLSAVQEHLLGMRIWIQATCRELTGQFLDQNLQSPVVIIQVDEDSD